MAAAAQAAAAAAAASRVPEQYSSELARKVSELEMEAARKRARLEGAAAKHHVHSLAPDHRAPFTDCFDAWQRLLPYHTMLPPDNAADAEQKRNAEKEYIRERYSKWSQRLSTGILEAVAPNTATPSSGDVLLLKHILLRDEVAEFKEAQRKRQQVLLAERQRQQALLQAQANAAAAEAHARAKEDGTADATMGAAQIPQQQTAQPQQQQHFQPNDTAIGSAPQLTGMQHQLASMQHLMAVSSAQPHQRLERHVGSAPQHNRAPPAQQNIPPLSFGMANAGRAALPGLGELNSLPPLPGIMGAPREQAAAAPTAEAAWPFGARSRQ